jgi:hypothetical protein
MPHMISQYIYWNVQILNIYTSKTGLYYSLIITMIFTLKLYKVCIETILQYILLVCYNYSCFLLCQTYLINQYIITLFTGTLSSLKHHKNEVDIIKKDSECGISLSENSVQYRRGDVIVCYKTIEIKPKIDWDPGF